LWKFKNNASFNCALIQEDQAIITDVLSFER
jgi:hypothetical protein